MQKALQDQGPAEKKIRRQSMYKPKQQSLFSEKLQEFKIGELVARGTPADMDEIDHLIAADSKAYLYEPSSKESMVNAPNSAGYTPLYIASQNGSLTMVKFLMSRHADPLILSLVGQKGEESNLAAAARWNHIWVVDYYLKCCTWDIDLLKRAREGARNTEIRNMITKKIQETKGTTSCWCCMPKKKK